MRTITTNVYTIDEHPDKEACYNYIRENWLDLLCDYVIEELSDAIKALTKVIGGRNNYAISAFPDRGEYIEFYDYSKDSLNDLNSEDCPLTGWLWDQVLIDALKENNTHKVLEALHKNCEHIYSDELLYELCMSNNYEFNEFGKFVF